MKIAMNEYSTMPDIEDIWDSIEELESRIDEVEKTQAVIENEMRTIMSDHSSFADVLKDLSASGLLHSGEKRSYGNY